jgi:hypothetical protein
LSIARTGRGLAAAVVASAICLAPAAALAGQTQSAAKPAVSLSSPKAGATTATTVKATVKLTNFKLSAKDVGKKPKAGEGHLHFSMDGGKYDHPKYSGANGKLAVTLGVDGKYSPSVTPNITYKGLPKGKHTLVVYLANNNHTNVGPKATVSFTVR